MQYLPHGRKAKSRDHFQPRIIIIIRLIIDSQVAGSTEFVLEENFLERQSEHSGLMAL